MSNDKSQISNDDDSVIVLPRETIAPLTSNPLSSHPLPVDSVDMPSIDIDKIAVVPFIERLNASQTSAASVEMRKLTDTAAIRLPMSVSEMSIFMGSTLIQTRLVYGYAPGHVTKLTPLQYVHLLMTFSSALVWLV